MEEGHRENSELQRGVSVDPYATPLIIVVWTTLDSMSAPTRTYTLYPWIDAYSSDSPFHQENVKKNLPSLSWLNMAPRAIALTEGELTHCQKT